MELEHSAAPGGTRCEIAQVRQDPTPRLYRRELVLPAFGACLPEWSKELPQLNRQQLRLLRSREVTAAWHLRPPDDVVGRFGPVAGSSDGVFLGEQCHT